MRSTTTVFFVLAAVLSASPALAHREDFIGETLVFLTLEPRSIEPEMFVDAARGYRAYNGAIEYGMTSHFMIDGRFTRAGSSDRSGRLELRYRFGEEGERPVDIAVSAEANFEKQSGESDKGVEPRLILSKDFQRLNLTANLAREIALSGEGGGFHIAGGTRFDATKLLRIGSEVLYDSRRRGGAVVPQVWLALPHDTIVRFGYFAGYGGEAHFVRLGVEIEL